MSSLFLDFHSGCAGSAGLVVFWVLLQLNFQFVPKKEYVFSAIIFVCKMLVVELFNLK